MGGEWAVCMCANMVCVVMCRDRGGDVASIGLDWYDLWLMSIMARMSCGTVELWGSCYGL